MPKLKQNIASSIGFESWVDSQSEPLTNEERAAAHAAWHTRDEEIQSLRRIMIQAEMSIVSGEAKRARKLLTETINKTKSGKIWNKLEV